MLYPELKKGRRTMSRGLNTRIQKLDARRRNDGAILLFWRMPGKDVATVVKAAKNDGLFASGDRVICVEWLGEDPMPAPRWSKSERDLSEQ
jgi:hypothetical protein